MTYGFKTGGRVAYYRKLDLVCGTCGQVFRSKSASSTYTPKYCSQKCFSTTLIKWSICEQCGKKYNRTTTPSGARNKRFCSKMCATKYQTGKQLSDEHKRSLSEAKKGNPIPHLHNPSVRAKIGDALRGKAQPWNRGQNHPNYIDGGKAKWARQKAMGRVEYKDWRRAVYDRDDYTCQICGTRGKRLVADHIKSWRNYPELRYEVSNGRTLCRECHIGTPNYGGYAGRELIDGGQDSLSCNGV